MELVRGDVVRSVAGHDKGSLMLVYETSGDSVLVVDGRLRKLEKPKKKNRRKKDCLFILSIRVI